MMTIGLILAVAAGCCCAYMAALAVERWVTWSKPHGWLWVILISGVATVVNIVVVAAATRWDVPLQGGALVVAIQIFVLIMLPIVCVGCREQADALSEAFVCLHIGCLAVQLVGVRLALAGSVMTFEASLWWLCGSWIVLSRFALAGMRRGRRQRVVRRDGGLANPV